MRSTATILSLAALAVAWLPSSPHAGEPDAFALDFEGAAISAARGGPFPATLADIQANIFTPSCALSFCHGTAMQANLSLADGDAFSNLVNVPSVEVGGVNRVTPFDPDNSYIICKLEACPWIAGSQMPLIGGPLDQSFIDVIRTWILMGAPETSSTSVEGGSWGQVKATYR